MKLKWNVQAVVVGPQHLDGLAIGSASGSDPTILAERVCAQLPHSDSPFGDFYLLATPAAPDRADADESAWVQAHAQVSRLQRSWQSGRWTPGRWRPVSSEPRFLREWPALRGCTNSRSAAHSKSHNTVRDAAMSTT